MSGGAFDYKQFVIRDISQKILELVNNNHKENEYGYANNFSDTTTSIMVAISLTMKLVSEWLHDLDYMLSGDIDEDTLINNYNKHVINVMTEYEDIIKPIIGDKMYTFVLNSNNIKESD